MKKLDPFWENNPANPANFYEEDGVYESWVKTACNEDDDETEAEGPEEMNEEEIKKIIEASKEDPYKSILEGLQ